MNVRLLAALTLLPLAAVLLVSTALAGRGAESVSTAKLRGVNFVSACTFSHAAADDPIVFPGKPGASHHHSFVGNATTSASSTLETLLGGGSTCHRPGRHRGVLDADAARRRPTGDAEPRADLLPAEDDASRRGVPARLSHDRGRREGDEPAAAPRRVLELRRRRRRRSRRAPCRPVRMRDATRSASTSPSRAAGTARTSTAPRTRATSPTRSPDAARRSSPMRCRRSRSSTATRSTGGAGVTLASGGQLSGHADFFNAWRQDELQSLVDGCLNALRHCQRGS